jgi:hypothetical protein
MPPLNDLSEVLKVLPPKPAEPRKGSVWTNNSNKHQYIVVGYIFDGTNSVDAWKVLYIKVEDHWPDPQVPFCRDVPEFLEKFTRMGG